MFLRNSNLFTKWFLQLKAAHFYDKFLKCIHHLELYLLSQTSFVTYFIINFSFTTSPIDKFLVWPSLSLLKRSAVLLGTQQLKHESPLSLPIPPSFPFLLYLIRFQSDKFLFHSVFYLCLFFSFSQFPFFRFHFIGS